MSFSIVIHIHTRKRERERHRISPRIFFFFSLYSFIIIRNVFSSLECKSEKRNKTGLLRLVLFSFLFSFSLRQTNCNIFVVTAKLTPKLIECAIVFDACVATVPNKPATSKGQHHEPTIAGKLNKMVKITVAKEEEVMLEDEDGVEDGDSAGQASQISSPSSSSSSANKA